MKIAILLPYKENFSKDSAGAVSIFVNDTNRLSKFKDNIKVFGSTTSKSILKNYKNLDLKKNFLLSTSSQYLNIFTKLIQKEKIDILEIHNRPHYINSLHKVLYCKKVLFFHNDPLKMQGSTSINDRINLLKKTDKIIFNSNWSKSRFIIGLTKNIDIK